MYVSRFARTLIALWLYVTAIALAWAAGTYTDLLHDLAARESTLNPNAKNGSGYVGLFQMGEAALIDAGYYRSDGTKPNDWRGTWTGKNGITSLEDFRANPDAQVRAIVDYQQAQWRVIQNLGLNRYIGQTINGAQITQSGLIAGAHLVGYEGLNDYLRSNGAVVPKDGNGTRIQEYIGGFAGYTISGIAPTFALVRGATGGAGASAGTSAPPSPTAGAAGARGPAARLPAAPAAETLSPDAAFERGSGYRFGVVAEAFKLIVAAAMFVWLAWTLLSMLGMYSTGRMENAQFQIDSVRATVLLMLMVVLLG